MSDERWLPVPGWDGFYEVSDAGRVRGLDRVVHTRGGRAMRQRGRVLTPARLPKGYRKVTLSDGWAQYEYLVHRLVLGAFVGECPEVLDEGCHGDGDPGNNALGNLRWDTTSENARDRTRHGRNRFANSPTCKRDHLLRAPNLTANVARLGYRGCLACSRALAAASKARSKGATIDVDALADHKYAIIMAAVA